MKYSIIIPIFNEERNLNELYSRLSKVMKNLKQTHEFIFIDDGSSDNSYQILKKFHQQEKRVKVIKLSRNFGQHPAVMAGFEKAKGEIIITIDGDLQNPPEEIPKLIKKLNRGIDVVTGWRETRNDPLIRRIGSKVINWIIWKLTKVKLKDYGCMLRVYRRKVIELLKRCPEQTKFITALVSWLGVSITEVKIRQNPRKRGISKYNYLKLAAMNFDLITGYSIFPIQIISFLGIGLSIIGFFSGLFLLAWRFIFGAGITGLVSFIALLLILFGLQLIALGIIGEYIGRIYIEAKRRPYYIIEKEIE